VKLHHKPSKTRILQISNDISEDMCNASNDELIATVKFWQNERQKLANALNSAVSVSVDGFIKAIAKAEKIKKRAIK
jgi:hypothetical protein